MRYSTQAAAKMAGRDDSPTRAPMRPFRKARTMRPVFDRNAR